MNSWWVLVALPLGYLLLKRWQAHVSVRAIERVPIFVETFEPVAADVVPRDVREVLEERTAPLVALGFERLGLVRSPPTYSELPHTRAVLRHPTEHAFAVAGFSLIGHELGLAVEMVTLFEDGTWVDTANGTGDHRLADLPQGRYSDALVSTVAEQWAAHRAAVTAAPAVPAVVPELETVTRHLTSTAAEMARLLVTRGEAVATEDPRRFRRSPEGARLRMQRRAAALTGSGGQPRTGADFGVPRLPLEEQERMYQEGSLGRRLRCEASRPRAAFVVSAFLFAASMLVGAGHPWLAFLMPVILVHELGHWTVMRLFGHRDATITFIPFLGAATTTSKPFAKRWQEIVMLLAGPLPGIVLGVALATVAAFRGWSRAGEAGLFMIGLNVINLLPLTPLDGGRIMNVLATAGRPYFELAFKGLAAVALLAYAVKTGDWVLGALGVAGLSALRVGARTAALERRIRRMSGFDVALPPPEKRRLIFAALSEPPVRRFSNWLLSMETLEMRLHRRRTPLWQSLSWTALFAAALGAAVYAFAGAARPAHTSLSCPSRGDATSVACAVDRRWGVRDWDRITTARRRSSRPPRLNSRAATVGLDSAPSGANAVRTGAFSTVAPGERSVRERCHAG